MSPAHDPWAGVLALRRAGLSGAGVGVGHLDSGLDAEHPALAECVAAYRFFDFDGEPLPERRPFDDCGHGTHTAGVIAARGLSERVGVAPGCRLHVAHVLEHGQVLARVLRGLDWLLDAPIRVLAMPIGVRSDTPLFDPLIDALLERDVLPIAPIGNLGPGRYHAPGGRAGVLSVGVIDDRGRIPRYSGSRRHPEDGRCLKPDLLAPGIELETCERGGGLSRASGTSIAAAFVAGVAALLFEACPDASALQVEAALCSSARPLSKGRRHRCRGGVIDPLAALAWLKNEAAPPREPPRAQPTPEAKLDRRLERLMSWAAPDELVPAIAMVHERELDRTRALLDELGRASAPAALIQPLRAGLVLLCAPTQVLTRLADRPELRYLSAQDVELV